MKLFILSSVLTKRTGVDLQIKGTQGYRSTSNEHEAKGVYLDYIKENFPDYMITDILCMEIPKDHLRLVLQEEAKA